MIEIALPWPSALLSGHAKGNQVWKRIAETKKLRAEATFLAHLASPKVPATGDIPITIRFHAPDNRGDRVNYPARSKPLIDGIADALGVNDRRLLPTWEYGENIEGGRVTVLFSEEVKDA